MNLIMAIAVAAAAIFGGTSITAYASQTSLPNQPLYAVKVLSEDLRLQMTGDLSARTELETNFIQTRFQEMAAIYEQGGGIPFELTQRMEKQTDQVLGLATRMGEDGIQTAMARLGDTLDAGDAMLRERSGDESVDTERVQQFLAERRELAHLGEQDPAQFTARYRESIGQMDETPEPDTPLQDRDRLLDMLRDRLRLRQTQVATDAPETPVDDETPAPDETLDPGTTPDPEVTPEPESTTQPQCTPQQDRLQDRDQDRDRDRDGSGSGSSGSGRNSDSGNGNGGSGGSGNSGGSRSNSGGGKKR